MSDFYILLNSEETGPFTLEQLQIMVNDGEITPETLYAAPGMSGWEPLSTLVSPTPNALEELESPPTQYDGARVRALLEEFNAIRTYQTAAAWREQAKEEMKTIERVLRSLGEAIARENTNLEQAKSNFEHQSFLKRTFGSHDSEEIIKRRISDLCQSRLRLPSMLTGLQEAIEIIPSTPEEKHRRVKELRLRKKELQAQKREEGAAMSAIRQEARVRSVHAGKTWLGFYDSCVAADERRGIRYEKEAALSPHEDAKAEIEQKLLRIDRDLLWLEEFE